MSKLLGEEKCLVDESLSSLSEPTRKIVLLVCGVMAVTLTAHDLEARY